MGKYDEIIYKIKSANRITLNRINRQSSIVINGYPETFEYMISSKLYDILYSSIDFDGDINTVKCTLCVILKNYNEPQAIQNFESPGC